MKKKMKHGTHIIDYKRNYMHANKMIVMIVGIS